MTSRFLKFAALLIASWVVMTFTHEVGHILGGFATGGTLKTAELRPWRLPYSIFEPDPQPLVTLWCGPLFGVAAPLGLALLVRRDWMWFIAHFCVLANGVFLAIGWIAGDRFLDTPQMLEHGASPIAIALYCLLTIGFGYCGFRTACLRFLSSHSQDGD